MTKACILLHAEGHRLCNPSVADGNHCKMFTFLCMGAFHSSRPPSDDQNGGKRQAGGGSGVDIHSADSLGFICGTDAPVLALNLLLL